MNESSVEHFIIPYESHESHECEQQHETDTSVYLMDGFQKQLYPHQTNAVRLMEEREHSQTIHSPHLVIQSTVGIYADVMGFGKTLAMLALIARDRMEWDLNHEYVHSALLKVYGNGCIVKKAVTQFKRLPCTLVICHASILHQWEQEIKGTRLRTFSVSSKKKILLVDPMTVDIILCIPAYFNLLIERFPNCAWKRFVFDEPTHVKIPSMHPIMAGFLWFMTATPDLLLLYHHRHTHNFMSTIFSCHMDYHLFRHLIVKNDDSFVRQSVELPLLQYFSYECYQPLYTLVHDLISPHIADMISAGNIESAVRCMGGNSTSNLFDLIEQEKTFDIHDCLMRIDRFQRLQEHDRVAKWTMKLEKLENDLAIFRHRWTTFVQHHTVCTICLEQQSKPILLTCCQNLFCGKCVLQWLESKSTCPLCRRPIRPDNILYLRDEHKPTESTQNSSSPFPSQTRLPTKIDRVLSILQSSSDIPHRKIIIFSAYNETFSLLRETLKEYDIPFYELYGRPETRAKVLDTFRLTSSHPCCVLLLNSLSEGSGLNLQQATDIILYHPMTEERETQIIGRSYRIGRLSPLYIHRLF